MRPFYALLLLLLTGCATTVAPLYRDYVPATADTVHVAQILKQAGWIAQPGVTPGTWRTQNRWMEDWGIYRIRVFLDVIPLRDGVIRIAFHPYRQYIVGGRSKLMYLRDPLRRRLFEALDAAFAGAGYRAAGSLYERDRVQPGR